MATCSTPNCRGEALSAEHADYIGREYRCEVAGRCADCALSILIAAAERLDAPGPGVDADRAVDPGEQRLHPVDDGLRALRWWRSYVEKSCKRGLDDLDRSIVELADGAGEVNRSEIARRLGVHRSTISRRVRHMRLLALWIGPIGGDRDDPRLDALPLPPDSTAAARWRLVRLMLDLWLGRVDWRDLPAEKQREIERHQRLAEELRKIRRQVGPRFERRVDDEGRLGKVSVTWPGRCLGCGRFIPESPTRPRKWCPSPRGDRCRKRFERGGMERLLAEHVERERRWIAGSPDLAGGKDPESPR